MKEYLVIRRDDSEHVYLNMDNPEDSSCDVWSISKFQRQKKVKSCLRLKRLKLFMLLHRGKYLIAESLLPHYIVEEKEHKPQPQGRDQLLPPTDEERKEGLIFASIISLGAMLTGMSTSDIRRLIKGGSVVVNDCIKVNNMNSYLILDKIDQRIRVGKKVYFDIRYL